MKRTVLSAIAGFALAASAVAGAIDFDLKDPKGVNNVVFFIDAPLESINGTATGISGAVHFDPAKPAATTGKIVIDVASMSVPNSKMHEHMMGGMWMDAEKHPEVAFELKSLSDVKEKGNVTHATAHGTMTIKGVSKEMSVPVTLTYLKDKLADRQKTPGDILVVRASFSVSRSDFGVNAGKMEDKVGDEIQLKLSVAGFAPKA